jgi:hypothetical protein
MAYTLRVFLLQYAVCFIILTYLVPVLFTFYTQGVLKFKKNYSCAKRLSGLQNRLKTYQYRYGTESKAVEASVYYGLCLMRCVERRLIVERGVLLRCPDGGRHALLHCPDGRHTISFSVDKKNQLDVTLYSLFLF